VPTPLTMCGEVLIFSVLLNISNVAFRRRRFNSP
jgi:hypothetical protein